MPTYPHIDRYHAYLAELIEAGGSDNELNIRPAFQNCLAAYSAAHREKLTLVPELRAPGGVIPDGTVKDLSAWPAAIGKPRTPTTTWTPKFKRKFKAGLPPRQHHF